MSDAAEILDAGHHCVVANPPYIVPPDKTLRDAYRNRYASAVQKYGLGVPFTERLWQLVRTDGFVAEITSNAFMKREHGKALVETVLPHLDLRTVIDTNGACIPGHGTPTVILAGTGGAPTSGPIRVVMSKRGEPSTPKDGDPGRVWASIEQALGLPVTAARAYGLDGLRLAEELAKTLRALAKEGAPRLGEWVAAYALLLAFEARGYLARRDEPLADAAERLEDLADVDGDAWLSGLSKSPLSAEHEAALRGAFARVGPPYAAPVAFGPQRAGWATHDTDWLGDLYQGANDVIVKRDALCQTPWFVRDLLFLLALSPALRAHGAATTVLDPACGTGHLLVGAFRVLLAWHMRDDEYTVYSAANRALAAVHGVELTPSTAALARYRLALAWLDATGAGIARAAPGEDALARVSGMPRPVVAVGDALLEGRVRPSPPVSATPVPIARIRGQMQLFAEAS